MFYASYAWKKDENKCWYTSLIYPAVSQLPLIVGYNKENSKTGKKGEKNVKWSVDNAPLGIELARHRTERGRERRIQKGRGDKRVAGTHTGSCCGIDSDSAKKDARAIWTDNYEGDDYDDDDELKLWLWSVEQHMAQVLPLLLQAAALTLNYKWRESRSERERK